MSNSPSHSKVQYWIGIPFALLIASTVQAAEKAGAPEPTVTVTQVTDGVPLTKVIDAVASRTQKRFLTDPRVRATVAKEGLDLSKISYRELQGILRLHGFAAVEIGGAINVLPDSILRYQPLPVIDNDTKNLGDDDYVIKVVNTGKLDATQLVPLLRPMLPQYAHLAATSSINSLLIVATYANVKTIEGVVRQLEKQPIVSRPAPASAGGDSRPAN